MSGTSGAQHSPSRLSPTDAPPLRLPAGGRPASSVPLPAVLDGARKCMIVFAGRTRQDLRGDHGAEGVEARPELWPPEPCRATGEPDPLRIGVWYERCGLPARHLCGAGSRPAWAGHGQSAGSGSCGPESGSSPSHDPCGTPHAISPYGRVSQPSGLDAVRSVARAHDHNEHRAARRRHAGRLRCPRSPSPARSSSHCAGRLDREPIGGSPGVHGAAPGYATHA
jgi:hypothetical protein